MKFALTRSLGAEVRTYDITRDHETGERDRLTREIAEVEGAVQASPATASAHWRPSATWAVRGGGGRNSSAPSAAAG